MRQKKLSLLCATLLAASALLAQQVKTTPVTIRVNDPTGSGVSHASVRLVPSANSASGTLTTDDRGQLSLNLQPGSYALFVSASGFKTAAQQIEIASPEGQQNGGQVVSVILRVGDVISPTPISPPNSLVLNADLYHAPVALTVADFHALPHATITVHNTHTNADETYSGVPLATLLAKVNAPIGAQLRKEALTAYLIATGSDGYSVIFSLAEVDPSFHAGQVLVADTRNGQPLADSGPFELVVTDDKRPARWVHNLNSITLQQTH
jgi:hypothetical protein